MGPAGAGKSTVYAGAARRAGGIAPPPILERPPHTLAAGAAPASPRTRRCSRAGGCSGRRVDARHAHDDGLPARAGPPRSPGTSPPGRGRGRLRPGADLHAHAAARCWTRGSPAGRTRASRSGRACSTSWSGWTRRRRCSSSASTRATRTTCSRAPDADAAHAELVADPRRSTSARWPGWRRRPTGPRCCASTPASGRPGRSPPRSCAGCRAVRRLLRRRRLRDDTLSRKASLNMAAALLDYGTRLVVGFIVNPVLVGAAGRRGVRRLPDARASGGLRDARRRPAEPGAEVDDRAPPALRGARREAHAGGQRARRLADLPAAAGGRRAACSPGSRRCCSGCPTPCTSPCGSRPLLLVRPPRRSRTCCSSRSRSCRARTSATSASAARRSIVLIGGGLTIGAAVLGPRPDRRGGRARRHDGDDRPAVPARSRSDTSPGSAPSGRRAASCAPSSTSAAGSCCGTSSCS